MKIKEFAMSLLLTVAVINFGKNYELKKEPADSGTRKVNTSFDFDYFVKEAVKISKKSDSLAKLAFRN